jgi:SHS family lactate transporter-like MFS transporter
MTTDYLLITIAFTLQGAFAGAIYGQNPSYLTERFPTEVRATAAAFCYHQGAIFAGLIAPVITYLAVEQGTGFAQPMLVFSGIGLTSFIAALLLGPETKGKHFVADLEIQPAAQLH